MKPIQSILKKIQISVHVSYLLYWHLPRIQCASLCTIIYNGRAQCSLWSVKHFLLTPLQHIGVEIKQCLQIKCWPKTVFTAHIPVVHTHCRNGNTFLTLETIVSRRHLKWRSVYSQVSFGLHQQMEFVQFTWRCMTKVWNFVICDESLFVSCLDIWMWMTELPEMITLL